MHIIFLPYTFTANDIVHYRYKCTHNNKCKYLSRSIYVYYYLFVLMTKKIIIHDDVYYNRLTIL